jgi:Protein of unknown function (DUF3833)
VKPNLACLFSLLVITGCSSLPPQAFEKSATRFELDRYFIGHTRSWGVLENRNGNPRLSFTCDAHGRHDATGAVVLTQHFRFSNGATQQRNWRIHRVDATHWEATANDMVGVARGEGEGNAFYWEYTLTLDPKNPLATIHIRQWLYQPEGTDTVMTRLVITKLGLTVSEVTESIHHVTDE